MAGDPPGAPGVPSAAAGPTAPEATATPAPTAPPRSGFRRFLDRWIPRDTDEPYRRSGFASDSRRDTWYLLLAFGIGIAMAAIWGWIVSAAPVPPGGDPSTWILTSYPYVGLPTTSGVQPLGYPPGSFPFVGLAVVLGGGPLLGGRLFMEGAIIALGVAAYYLGRSLLERPSLALFAEGLWLAEPDFQQLYYFGGYPNIFALIFLTLALAFFVRFLRSREPNHLLLFWIFAAVCLLSHTLTGAVLLGIVALLALALLVLHRLPRAAIASRASYLGIAIFAISNGAYYGGTALLGVAHPTYVQSTTVTTVKTQLLPSVLHPFYLSVLVQAIQGPQATISTSLALDVILVGTAIIFGAFVLLRWKRPHVLTTPWLLLASWILVVFGIGTGSYVLNIAIDYRRLPYFLYPTVVLLVVLPFDLLISNYLSRPVATNDPAEEGAPRLRGRRVRRSTVDPMLVLVTLSVVAAATSLYTVPQGQSYESFYTLYAHDQNFLDAVGAIAGSRIPGNLVATTPYVAHWPSTLTDTRITYVPALANGNGYDPTKVIAGELTSITVSDRITVTNSLVGAGLQGTAAGGNFNASPVYGAFATTVFQPYLQLPLQYLVYGVRGGGPFPLAAPGTAAPPVIETASGYGFELVFVEPNGVTIYENVTAVPNTSTVTIAFTGVATNASVPLEFISFRLTNLPGLGGGVVASSPGSFVWTAPTRVGTFNTTATVTPTVALARVSPAANGAGPYVVVRQNSTNATGDPTLSVGVALATPGASNVLTNLGPWIDSAQTWSGWNVRFLLQYNGSTGATGTASTKLYTPAFLAAEYGATLYDQTGAWQVYLLPSVLPAEEPRGPTATRAGATRSRRR